MKLYTDRFETALPPELRERFRGRFCYVKPEPVLPEAPRVLPKLSTLLEPPEGKKTPWVLLAWSTIVLLLGGIFLMTYEQVHQQNASAPPIDNTPRERPALIMQRPDEVVSVPAPAPAPKPIPEVRRADILVQMPYGETMWARVLGHLPDQEHLPMTGNSVGDAYLIGPHEFVWTEAGQWIDPIVK